MFTGLIETTGTLRSLTPTEAGTRITIEAPQSLMGRLRLGDSVAVSGVCLTALDLPQSLPETPNHHSHPQTFAADLAQETLDRTTLAHLAPGARLNLELPTPAGSPLGGHVVQGHVDGIATVLALDPIHPGQLHSTDWRLALQLPPALARNVVPQGSLTVDGISLTVARLVPAPDGSARVEIAIIPHTWKSTSLQHRQPGDRVNIETDILARYAARQAAAAAPTAAEATSEPRNEWLPAFRRDTTPPPDPTDGPAQQPADDWLTTAFLLSNGY